MSKRRKTYPPEFKREAVRLLQSAGKPAARIEEELGIGDGCLLRWKKQLEEEGENAFNGHGRVTPDQERLRELEQEILTLRRERDILKKAIAIVSHPGG